MNEEQEKIKVEETKEEGKKIPKEHKKRGKGIIIIILLIIAIAVGLYVGFEKLNSNPLSIYKRAINDTVQLLDNFLEENTNHTFSLDPTKEAFLVDTNFTIDVDNEDLSILNNYNYDLSLGIDYPNNQMNVALGLKDEEEEILNLLVSFMNDHAYLQSKELYDQILDLGSADLELDLSALSSEEMPNLDYQNIRVILLEMKDIIINSLDPDKFSMTEETIEIDGSKVESKKITYLLDQENMERTISYITKEMIENEKLMAALVNITGQTKEEITHILEEEVDFTNYEDIEIALYVKGLHNVIAGTLTEGKENLIRFTYQEEVLNMLIGDEYSNATINVEDNIITLSYSEYGEEILNGVLNFGKEEKQIELTTNDYGDTITLRLTLSNLEEKKDSFQSDITIDLDVNTIDAAIQISASGSLKVEKGKLPTLDVENSIDINSLSTEEQNKISENLLKVLEKLNLNDYFVI